MGVVGNFPTCVAGGCGELLRGNDIRSVFFPVGVAAPAWGGSTVMVEDACPVGETCWLDG